MKKMARKILIIDDEQMLTEILEDYFRSEDKYMVFTAQDGERAQQIIKEKEPDLVLLDMKLPGIDGIELLKLLRLSYPQTRVIVMTSYDLEYKKKMDAIGYDYLFIKPLSVSELEEKVESLLKRPEFDKKESIDSFFVEPSLKEASPKVEEATPQARILIMEPRKPLADLLKAYLEDEELSKGSYTVLPLQLLDLERVACFNPQIVLYDIMQIGIFSEFASEMMKLREPPREIILFGDPSFKWEEVEVLIERGMSYIQTPLKKLREFLSSEFEFPSRETVDRLSQTVRNICFKYSLFRKER